MFRRIWSLLVLVLSVLVVAPSSASAQPGDSPLVVPLPIFTTVSAPPGIDALPPGANARFAVIDVMQLRDSLIAGQRTEDARLALELLPDVVAQLQITDFTVDPEGFSIRGRYDLPTGEEHHAVLVASHSPGVSDAEATWSVNASFWVGQAMIEITPVDVGVVLISERDSSDSAPRDASQPTDNPGDLPVPDDDVVVPAPSSTQFSGWVDVLGVYTPAARASFAGNVAEETTAISANLKWQINLANLSNANNGIAFRFRLVHAREIAFVENKAYGDDDLDDLKSPTDGVVDGVHALRADYGADLVLYAGRGYSSTVQVTYKVPVCGLGGTALWAGKSEAFALIDVGSTLPSGKRNCDGLTAAHEMGHVMDLEHDWDHSIDTSATPGVHYNHGFVNPAGDYKDIMAYDLDACSSLNDPAGTCLTVPYWSDAVVKYKKMPLGVPGNSEAGRSADGARRLRETVRTVAGFLSNPNPFGHLDEVQRIPGKVAVRGWAIDPDRLTAITVHVYVDPELGNPPTVGTADTVHTGAATAHPSFGSNHGFDIAVATGTGVHRFCAYGINVDNGTSNTTLGCLYFDVLADPVGDIQTAARAPGGARIKGWALDPSTAGAIDIHVYVDGVSGVDVVATANLSNSSSLAAYPEWGSAHGFSVIVPMSAGVSHEICVYGINVGLGSNTLLDCASFTPDPNPLGGYSGATRAPGGIRARGWAVDRDVSSSISVRITVNGVDKGSFLANESRGDIAAALPDYGAAHGFSPLLPVASAGTYSVCVTLLNVGLGSNVSLGCDSISVSGTPAGTFSATRAGATQASVVGWALDPDTASAITVAFKVTGVPGTATSATANQPNTASYATYPEYGSNHGYDLKIVVPPGTQQICATATNVAGAGLGGADKSLGCVTVT